MVQAADFLGGLHFNGIIHHSRITMRVNKLLLLYQLYLELLRGFIFKKCRFSTVFDFQGIHEYVAQN